MEDIVRQHLRIVNVAGFLAIAAIVGGSVGLGVFPAYRKGKENIDQTRYLQGQVDQLNGLSQELDVVEAERQETAKRLAEAERRLPTSSQMDEFMTQLSDAAANAKLQMEGVTPSKDLKDAGGYKSRPVEISGTGDWESCYQFLTGIRAMNRLTRLDSVSLDLSRDTRNGLDHPMCRMVVHISTFMAR